MALFLLMQPVNIRRLFFALRVCVAVLLAVALSGSAVPGKLRAVLLPDARVLQVGDWVLRSGTSADSRLIKSLSQSRFSHIGIVVQTQPHVLVVHATTDDEPAKPNQVLMSTLADFAAARRADGLAVVRPRFLSAEQRTATARYAAARQGHAFSLQSRENNPFYCTTLLLDAIRQQNAAFQPQWQYLDVPVFRGDYLFPQAFLQADVDWIYADMAPARE